ncbi:hypothetical protein CORC01_02089 [Colletotrichum orchidophilum]|uniref:Uncharacterized protein n=1 Tax=Colletotrichum orchidophilum TaxID=1209926 RepID=A0A1G4BN27_9PEZI|nr:uncharacterized protein CORC01_02089 [Colletotrichum orchidophilum]OHF02693.1 hypothetical protein CORC01_02089 [Colletotrichum orchidophilum]
MATTGQKIRRRSRGSISEDETGSRPENVEKIRHRTGLRVWAVDSPLAPPPADAYLSDKSCCAAGQLKVNFKRACSVPPPATAAAAAPPSLPPPPPPPPPPRLPTNNVDDVDDVPAPSWRRQSDDSISSTDRLRIANGLAWKLQLELELELRLELLRLTPSSTWSRGSLLSATLRS